MHTYNHTYHASLLVPRMLGIYDSIVDGIKYKNPQPRQLHESAPWPLQTPASRMHECIRDIGWNQELKRHQPPLCWMRQEVCFPQRLFQPAC